MTQTTITIGTRVHRLAHTALRGPRGPAGADGPPGEQGPKGDTGDVTTEAIAARDAAQEAASDAADSANLAEQARLLGATIGFATKAAMDADLAHDAGTLALVTNDPTPANNVTYRKTGASGSGSWVQSADRVTGLEQATANYRAAGDPIRDSSLDGYAWSIQDAAGRVAAGVKDDGTLAAASLEPDKMTVAGSEFIESTGLPELAWSIQDGVGNVALGVRLDGSVIAAGLEAGVDSGLDFGRLGLTLTHQLNFINNAGQSLAGGSDGAITTTQEYDNVGFPAASTSPASYLPLTTGNTASTQSGGGTESPMYGTCGHIKALIDGENGVDFTADDYQLLACNNGSSGAPIDEIKKGGSRGMYELAMSQVQSGMSIAASEMRTFAFQAVTWTQGESDEAMEMATYRDKLIQLAADFNADGKAITGQAQPVHFITYQGSRYAGRDTVTRAHLEASERIPYIHCATPIYFMPFYDGTHLTAAGSKWLGGYYGLVYKRVVIDRKTWEPLKPVHHTLAGNVIDLQFNKEGLIFDTTLFPAQANMGFTVHDAGGAAIAVSSVSITGPSRVRITCASPPQPGWRVKYGHIQTVGKANWTGCGGNLRDRQGDTLTYAGNAMHNWCVILDYEV